MPTTRYKTFIATVPRLERYLDEELTELGLAEKRSRKRGGTELYVSREKLYALAHDMRIGEHIRVRVADFPCRDFGELNDGLKRAAFSAYYDRGACPPVDVSTSRSRLIHSDAVAERVSKYLRERLQAHGPVDESLPTVYVRVVKDVAIISIDASGELLHKRGIRTRVGKAPLRETLAAACLRAAGGTDAEALWDPFCGSGVFLIERLLSRPRLRLPREFAFEKWRGHDPELYRQIVDGRDLKPVTDGMALYGSEKNGRAANNARANLKDAGGEQVSAVFNGDFTGHIDKIPEGASIITNPPWGHRMGKGEVNELGAAFGAMLRKRPDIRDVHVLTANKNFEGPTRMKWRQALNFEDGGTHVRLLKYVPRKPRAQD